MAEARVGRTFGRVAGAYDRTRPGYPAAAIDRAVAELRLARDATVLDLGAGTGKLTRLLRERFDRVLAVEPDDDLRAYIGGTALAGAAEEIPLDDGAVDAVCVGEAFHWFDASRALAEIARVLRPGGGLAVVANEWGERRQPGLLPTQLKEDLDRIWARFHAADASFADWRDDVAGTAFGPLGHASFDWTARIAGRDLVDLQLTASTPASIDDDQRRAVAERAYPLVEPEYDLTVQTELYWTRLR
ncbi:MAG: class I SAM-dependent methyltransferase [Gaiellaceae bacterium]